MSAALGFYAFKLYSQQQETDIYSPVQTGIAIQIWVNNCYINVLINEKRCSIDQLKLKNVIFVPHPQNINYIVIYFIGYGDRGRAALVDYCVHCPIPKGKENEAKKVIKKLLALKLGVV